MRVAANQVRGPKGLTERTIQKGTHCAVSATELTTRKINADYVSSRAKKDGKARRDFHLERCRFPSPSQGGAQRLFWQSDEAQEGNLQWLNQIVRQRKGCNSFRPTLETQSKCKQERGTATRPSFVSMSLKFYHGNSFASLTGRSVDASLFRHFRCGLPRWHGAWGGFPRSSVPCRVVRPHLTSGRDGGVPLGRGYQLVRCQKTPDQSIH